MANHQDSQGAQAAGPLLHLVGHCDRALWGLVPSERHARAFRKAGVVRILAKGETPPAAASVILIRAEYVIASELVQALAETPGVILSLPDAAGQPARPVAAHVPAEQFADVATLLEQGSQPADGTTMTDLRSMTPVQLGPAYNRSLRRRPDLFALSLNDDAIEAIEKKTFAAVYKGATDFVTKWCWPVPARRVTRWAAAWGISPNSVTTASLVLVFVALYFFMQGQFLAGIAAGWLMTFLDTVDGKLARVTMTSSPWGNVYDHGIDLIHPPFWWWAWWTGLMGQADPALLPALELALWIICIGYVIGRLMEGFFHLVFKVQTHIWRPIDYFFRTITARRNPNLAILMIATLLGRPDLGFLAVAAWTVISLAFHGERILHAAVIRLRGGRITSWLSESV